MTNPDDASVARSRSLFTRIKSAVAPKDADSDDELPSEPPVLPADRSASRLEQAHKSPFRFGFFAALGVLIAIALSEAILAVQNILVLVVLSFVLALGASPLVNFLSRKMHRTLAMALVTVTVLGIVALGIWSLVPLLMQQASSLVSNLPHLLENLLNHNQVRAFNERYGVIDRLQMALQRSNLSGALFNGVLGAGAVVVNFLFSAIITLVLTLYFLASLDSIKHFVYNLAPASQRARVKHIANGIFSGVSGYIQGMGIVVALSTIASFLFLQFAGLASYSVALAFAYGLCCFIPVLGPPTGAVMVCIIAFSVNPIAGIAGIVFFVVYQQIDAYVIYPNVMGRTVKVPGVLVVLSALIGGLLLGIIGAILAIPTAAAIILIWKEVVKPALDQR